MLPTKEECDELCKTKLYYRRTVYVDGHCVTLYNYSCHRKTPTELRGLSFVEQPNGEWERNLLLTRFFNIEKEDVLNCKFKSGSVKYDGSVVSFIKFPTGKIFSKSKGSFNSEQAIMANKIYSDDKNLRKFIDYCYDNDLTPIFELISPENKIVVNYPNTELILIQIRRFTGEYLNKDEIQEITTRWNVKATEYLPDDTTLDEIVKWQKENKTDIEGWVVTLDDGRMIKVKTNLYSVKHSGVNPVEISHKRSKKIVDMIIDDKIDDYISILKDSPYKERVKDINNTLVDYITTYIKAFTDLFEEYKKEGKRYIVDNYRKHFVFQGLILLKNLDLTEEEIYDIAYDRALFDVKKKYKVILENK